MEDFFVLRFTHERFTAQKSVYAIDGPTTSALAFGHAIGGEINALFVRRNALFIPTPKALFVTVTTAELKVTQG